MARPDASPTAASGGRLPLLDLWRGIALVDMAWVHLASYPVGMTALATDLVTQHTRFAAGCLVLLSGMTVRTAFGARLAVAGPSRAATVRRLLRRAGLLLVVDRLACLGFAVLARVALDSTPLDASLANHLVRVAFFVEPGATGGLLLLYCVLLTATPALERLRQLGGGAALVASSLAVFAAAQAAGQAAHWPPWAFPVAHWQPLFVLGYAAAPAALRVLSGPAPQALVAALAAMVAAASVFALRSPALVGLDAASLPTLDFGKYPLRPAELGWYLAASAFVMTWSALAWRASAAARSCALWLERLGRWSLLAYVSHLLLEPPIVAVVTILEPSPWWRAVSLPLLAAAMAAVTLAAERHDRLRRERAGPGLRRPGAALDFLRDRVGLPTAGAVGGALATACLAVTLAQRPWMVEALARQQAGEAAQREVWVVLPDADDEAARAVEVPASLPALPAALPDGEAPVDEDDRPQDPVVQ